MSAFVLDKGVYKSSKFWHRNYILEKNSSIELIFRKAATEITNIEI